MEEKKDKECNKSTAVKNDELKNISGGMASRFDIMDKQRPNKMSDRKVNPENLYIDWDNF